MSSPPSKQHQQQNQQQQHHRNQPLQHRPSHHDTYPPTSSPTTTNAPATTHISTDTLPTDKHDGANNNNDNTDPTEPKDPTGPEDPIRPQDPTGPEDPTATEAPDATDTANAADEADPPLPMTASMVLSTLPGDAKAALRGAGVLEGKVTIRFQPVGSAPRLHQRVFKIAAGQRFASVLRFLKRKLALRESESVFCYVNSVFAPGLDEGVGNLWRCFKVKNELVVAYSITPAFG